MSISSCMFEKRPTKETYINEKKQTHSLSYLSTQSSHIWISISSSPPRCMPPPLPAPPHTHPPRQAQREPQHRCTLRLGGQFTKCCQAMLLSMIVLGYEDEIYTNMYIYMCMCVYMYICICVYIHPTIVGCVYKMLSGDAAEYDCRGV